MQDEMETEQKAQERTEELDGLLQAFGPSWKRCEQGDDEDNQSYMLGYN